MASGIDFSALQVKPSVRKVATWRETLRRQEEAAGRHGAASGGPQLQVPTCLAMVMVTGALACVLFLVASLPMALSGEADGVGFLLSAVLMIIIAGFVWVVLRRRFAAVARGFEEHYQLMAFANSNGFDGAPVAEGADLPGRIFGRGLAGNRVRHDLVAWTQGGRQCHVATESWHSGNPPDGSPPEDQGSCRYLAVLLAEEGPDAAGLSDTVFTEQVQALLAVPTAPWEAEVAGGWFIAYQPESPDPLDVAVWQRMFALVDALPPYRLPAPA